MKEKNVESAIIRFLEHLGAYCLNINSGASKQSYTSKKTGFSKDRFIRMCPKGTADILCCIDGNFVAIEVKKDEVERKKRCRLSERFMKGEILPKSYDREVEQFKKGIEVANASGTFLCTYSIGHLIELFEDLAKREDGIKLIPEEFPIHIYK